jgi:Zn-finger protein
LQAPVFAALYEATDEFVSIRRGEDKLICTFCTIVHTKKYTEFQRRQGKNVVFKNASKGTA